MRYPIVLAVFQWHGDQFQVWNQEETLWLVVDKSAPGDMAGPRWERVTILPVP